MRKKIQLICVAALCFSITGCSTKNTSCIEGNEINESEVEGKSQVLESDESSDAVDSTGNAVDVYDEKETEDEAPSLRENEGVYYSGYMDEADEDWISTKYELSDYDNDLLNDRVYREASYTNPDNKAMGLLPDKISYRIDFANGDTIELGPFDDAYLGIKIVGGDLTGDGINEIIFQGHHDAMTNPESVSEIAVFQKHGSKYEMMPLSIPVDYMEGDKYIVGYPVYGKNDTGSEITLYADYSNYEETIHIDRTDNNRDERYRDKDIISNYAWGTGIENYEDRTALVLYQSIGGRNYYKDTLKIVLVWQDGEFKPVKIEIVDKHYW